MTKNNKKGFTLIELIAVIVLIAIISLIAVATINGIINRASKKSLENTAYGLVKAGNLYYTRQDMKGQKLEDKVFKFPNNTEGLDLNGKAPEDGQMTINKEGDISLAIKNDKYCITKGYHESEITITEDVDNCIPPVQITNIVLSKNTLNLSIGQTSKIEVSFEPFDATNTKLKYTSSNKNVATVENGNITAVGGGTAIITVTTTDGSNISKEITVTVAQLVSDIEINTESISLVKGGTYQLEAEAIPDSAENRQLSYESKNTNIATVSNTGLVTGLSNGETKIIVSTTDGSNITKEVTVIVQVLIENIILDKTNVTLNTGTSVTVNATTTPEGTSNKGLVWKSNDESIATVDKGIITGKKAGTTTVTVSTTDGSNISKTINVTVKQLVTEIVINGDTTVNTGKTITLNAEVTPNDASNKALSWKSSDENIATVSNGVVTGKKAGKATITATATDGSNISDTIEITVVDEDGPAYTSYEIKNITSSGYDVYVYGVSDVTGIDKVFFPTWTEYNEKDDLVENSNAIGENKGNGTYYFRVNTENHNGESGTYYTEIQLCDMYNNKTIIDKIKTVVPSIGVTITVNDSTAGKVSYSTVNVGYGAKYTVSGNTITFPAGQTVTATVLNPIGYTTTFTGWSIKSGTITEATTITANFTKTANTYEIVYDANGGTGAPAPTSYTYAESGTITLSDKTPTRTGYTFEGWGTTKDDTTVDYNPGGAFNKNIAQNTTLYAIWKINTYTVNYDANGGTGTPEPTTYIYDADENTTLSTTEPTRTGYTFVGWSQDKSATTKEYDAGDIWWRGNVGVFTLYAIWTPSSNTKYVVNHYQMNTSGAYPTSATETENKTGTTDSTLTLSNLAKTYTGFEYAYGQVGGTTVTTTTVAPDGTRVINLYYTRNKYTVTLTKGTGISEVSGAGEYYHGASVTIDAVVSNGYEWKNWSGTHSTTTKQYTFTMPTSNVSDTANASIITYTISYELNGGTATNPTSYNVETATFTLTNPTREGYTFTGWTGSNGETPSTLVNVAKGSTGNRTYTANFTPNTDTKYTVNHYQMNTSGIYPSTATETESKQGTTDSTITISNLAKTYTGFTYDSGKVGNDVVTTTTVLPNGTRVINLYYTRTKYTVTLTKTAGITEVSGAGSYYHGVTVAIDATVAPGYEWKNWTGTHTTTTKQYTFTMPTSNVSDTANANIITYALTYYTNGGTNPSDAVTSYNVETETFNLPTPVRTGYTFEGWYPSSELSGTKVTEISKGTTGNKVFYAKWSANTNTKYTVNHYQMNTSGTYPSTATEAESKTGTTDSTITLSNLAKNYTGFTYNSGKVGNDVVTTTTVAPDGTRVINLYYTRNQYTVTLTKGTGIFEVTGAGKYYYGETVTIDATVLEGYTWSSWSGIHTTTTKQYTFNMTASNVSDTANATANTYSVSYDANGGTNAPSATTYTYDPDKYTNLSTDVPTKTGYEFLGWSETKDSAIAEIKPGDEWWQGNAFNKTIYAVWKGKDDTEYTVNHYLMNTSGTYPSSAAETESKQGTTDSTITLSTLAKTYTGFTYNSGKVGTTTVTTTTVAPDGSRVINLYYTRNKYTVTLTKGTGISAVSGAGEYYHGASVTIDATVSAGYEWKNWTGTYSTTTKQYTFTMPASNVSDTANTNIITYSITYDTNGGTNPSDAVTSYNVTTETFNLPTPTKIGYTFNGWFSTSNGSRISKISQGTTGNISVIANWTANANTKYTVQHYQMQLDGTYPLTETENKTGKTNSSLTLSNLAKTYEGFTYIYGQVDGTDVTSTTIAPDGTRVIKLYYMRNQYTVSLTKGTGISSVSGAGNYYYGASVTIDATVLDGYEWSGWTGAHTTTTKQYTFTMPASNVSNTANASVITYSISYTLNGGSASNPTSYDITTETFTLVKPTRTGYTFTGWTGSNGNTPSTSVSITKGSTGNKTYTANWKVNSYTITYDYNLNRTYQTSTYTSTAHVINWDNDFKIEETINFATSGLRYLIIGNYNASDTNGLNIEINASNNLRVYFGTGQIDKTSGTMVPGENINIVFSWSASTDTYTITAKGNSTNISFSGTYSMSGTSTNGFRIGTADFRGTTTTFNPITVSSLKISAPKTYGTTLGDLPTSASSVGYALNGWYTASTGGTQISSATTVASNTTYYAQWKINTLTINYSLNGGSLGTSTSEYTWTNNGDGIIYRNGSIYKATLNYGGALGSDGLANYNNTTYLNTVRTGHRAPSGAEWVCLSGCSTSGKTFSQKTAYAASDFCDLSSGSCTVVLGVNWQINKVSIAYHVNGGTIDADAGGYTWTTNNSLVYMNGSKLLSEINYGSSLGSSGLNNYNNSGYIHITKTGYSAPSEAEWICLSGDCSVGTTYSQKTAYAASDFCDASNGDCSVVLGVNWKANTNTKYTVNHYQMNTSGSYPSSATATESKTGTTAATLSIAGLAKTYTGFTYSYGQVGGSTVTTTTIAADGSRVINLYYSRNKYTVSLNKGTGISAVSGAGSYYHGVSVTINATVSNGYTWSKWTGTHSTTTKKYTFTMPTSNVSDTANATANTYTITYHANGGSGAPSATSYTYNPNANTTLSSTIPTRTNYTFLGWSESSSATSATYSAGQDWWRGNTANYNLYAVWADRTGPSFTSFTGELLHTDPDFASGYNGISAYLSSYNTITRKSISGIPNSSGYGLQITTTGADGSNYGGIGFGTTCPAYSQNIYVVRIVAKIPSGYYLQFASNAWPAVADNGWHTNNWNSGDWEEYIFYFSCGAYGAEFTTNYFYLSGGTAPTSSNPVTWYVATATVINLSGNDNYIISYAEDALSKVSYHQHTTSSATPSSWNTVKTNKTAGSGYKVSSGTHYIWFKDSAGNANSWKITVPN